MSADTTKGTDYDTQLRELCVTTYGMTEVETDIAEALHAGCWCESEHDLYEGEGIEPYEGCGPWTELRFIRNTADKLRPVHIHQAARSLRAIAEHRLATAPDAVAHARAEGINEAARMLERGLEDEGANE